MLLLLLCRRAALLGLLQLLHQGLQLSQPLLQALAAGCRPRCRSLLAARLALTVRRHSRQLLTLLLQHLWEEAGCTQR